MDGCVILWIWGSFIFLWMYSITSNAHFSVPFSCYTKEPNNNICSIFPLTHTQRCAWYKTYQKVGLEQNRLYFHPTMLSESFSSQRKKWYISGHISGLHWCLFFSIKKNKSCLFQQAKDFQRVWWCVCVLGMPRAVFKGRNPAFQAMRLAMLD